ncbi:hypothetical protein G3O08_08625 [Cryomorpha ignava]|uniref:Uncharacterized protein n=1 Tax=Cryomorpha ignava TaxID=101383 RepID=A0A7K3WPH5_9FLAO|nr:hypothetical protein [Cryomorpha ignava]NEN23563.1 hypothetical protein [Cryomorpha ignava]
MPSVFLKSDTSKTASTGTLKLPKPEVHVYFRPHSGYNGEFGFDWMRTGDTGHNGDDWYKNIVGRYREPSTGALEQVYTTGVFTKGNSDYSSLTREYELLKHPTRPNDFYSVAIVNLLPGKVAKFSLKVEVKNAVSKIEFKFDSAFFNLNITELAETSIGKRSLKNHLEVTCVQEFSSDQKIEILADGQFAGKLIFKANDKAKRYTADFVMVKVWTDINATGTPNKAAPSGREDELKKYLNQAFVNPSHISKSLNLSNDSTFNTNYSSGGKIKNAGSDALLDHIIKKFEDKYGAAKYSKHYKLFFINEDAGGLYGRSYGIGGANRAVVVYKKGFADSTLAHETLHAMGLYHSFDNDGKFTFEKNKTDNIMDYSDIAVPPLDVISTWQWQWPLIRKNSVKEK